MSALVAGHDKVVAQWAEKKFGRALAPYHAAFGIIDASGALVGAALFQDFNGSNVEVSYFGRNALRLNIVRGLMLYAFDKLRVNRMTVRTPARNKPVSQHIVKLGFRHEGSLKYYYGPFAKDTALLFGLTRKGAERFIGKPDHVSIR